MSKSITNQNLKLLQVLHSQLPFLSKFPPQHLQQLSTKCHYFVFTLNTILAKQNQQIDFIGIVLQGKIKIKGDLQQQQHQAENIDRNMGIGNRRGVGFCFGQSAYCGIVHKHARSIVGDGDGIVMAIRLEDINKFHRDIQVILHNYLTNKCIQSLKCNNLPQPQTQPQQIQQKKLTHLYNPLIKSFLNQLLDARQKQTLLKHFPIIRHISKSRIVSKFDQPYLLIIIKGQLIIKSQQISLPPSSSSSDNTNNSNSNSNNNLRLCSGQFYNTQGFILNYSPYTNIYCMSAQSFILKINRRELQNLGELQIINKIDQFCIKKQCNDKKYYIQTYQARKLKQKQKATGVGSIGAAGKWNMFAKKEYEIIPLVIPVPKKDNKQKQKQKQKEKGKQKQKQKQKPKQKQKLQKTQSPTKPQTQQKLAVCPFQSTLFKQQFLLQQQQSKTQKTSSSINQKLNKIITLKTQKTQQKSVTLQNQLKQIQKQLQIQSSKLKFYQQNYSKCKLSLIEYQSKYKMTAVFKQINQIGQKKYKVMKGGISGQKVMTLKKAFQQHMKENKIMEVVARCAYKWLWIVRRKKGIKRYTSLK